MNTFKVSVPVYFIVPGNLLHLKHENLQGECTSIFYIICVLGNLLHLKHEHLQGECTSIFYIICVLGNLHHVFVFFYVFFNDMP